jgi:aryl-alcohol dehydrogenase-like predicted oxidoreductase
MSTPLHNLSNQPARLGGMFTFPGTGHTVHRLGYGAMQLAGPGVYGPPRDPDAALAVLREAISSGINHIDTSDFYGPYVTNQLIHTALHPYPKDLVIVTKVGARREADKSWHPALSREELISAVHDNLRHLGLEALDVVNLRVGGMHSPSEFPIDEQLNVLAELKSQGLIRHLGLSNVTPRQVTQAQSITEIVCVQNYYNVAHREDDAFLQETADALQSTPMQVALAWLLQRSPNILLIPGTSSVAHLRENIQSAALELPADIVTKLNTIGAQAN